MDDRYRYCFYIDIMNLNINHQIPILYLHIVSYLNILTVTLTVTISLMSH